MGRQSRTRRWRFAAVLGAMVISALGISAIALGAAHTVGTCSFQPPQTSCGAQAVMKNKPKAIVIAASVSPAQGFRARFRVFCQGGGGEFTFVRTGSLNGSQSATKVVHIPKKR